MKIIKIITLISIMIIYPLSIIWAQSTDIEFRVNMNHFIAEQAFFPDSETVDIAGTFNGWGGNLTPMEDDDDDGIYVAIISLTVGETVEFKCRINGEWNGREEFPGGGPNRSYTVEEDGVVEFWYNDEDPSALQVKIYASSTFADINEQIQFFDVSSGDPVAWSWEFPGGSPSSSSDKNPVISYSTEGNYSVTLTITNEESESASKTFSNYIRVGQKQTFWWHDAVFYEVFVRSFKDSNNDGKGDIQGLIQKLDYLNDGNLDTDTDLGITGIWLMPIQESPSYHGYDVTDYRTVAQDYGTNADFLQLIEEAHARGIKVIIDLVMNHTSSQHPWFIQSANSSSTMRDWYVWESTNPGFNGPWGQTVWHYRNGHYYYGLFWSGMPDLNFNHPDVKDEIFDVARFWLEEMNVDGFRLDAVKYIYEDGENLENLPETIEFWKDFRAFYKDVNPDAFSVGEAWASTQVVMPYVNDDALDYCFEFEMAGAIMNAVASGNSGALPATMINVMKAYPYLQFGTFLTNHDMNRVMSVFAGDEVKAKLAANLLLTLPGIPYIYYGEEIGMTGVKPDEYIRTPMQWNSSANAGFTNGTPWIAVNSDYTTKNVEIQQADPNSLWNRYRRLIHIRNQQIALRRGNYKPVKVDNPSVYAFLRQYNEENILVVTNLSNIPLSNVTVQVPFSGLPSSSYVLANLNSEESQPFALNPDGLTEIVFDEIPAQTTCIFKVQNSSSVLVDNKLNSSISIFPVPTSDYIYVQIQNDDFGKVNYSISDITGRPYVHSYLIHSSIENRYPINVSTLNSGIYIMQFNQNGVKHAKRIIIQ